MARRRRKYTWLPNLGTGSAVNSDRDHPGREFLLSVTAANNSIIVPVTFDVPQEVISTGEPTDTPLSEIIGNEYIIERIVGNIFVNTANAGDPGAQSFAARVTAGFFVARADQANPDAPIGSAVLADETRNYSPAFIDNIREPWMWRRVWLLGKGPVPVATAGGSGVVGSVTTTAGGTATDPGQTTTSAYPCSNVYYGTAVGGPFFDIKSSRRVGQDERLFFILAAQSFPIDTVITETFVLNALLDLRILGAIVKSHNKSTF